MLSFSDSESTLNVVRRYEFPQSGRNKTHGVKTRASKSERVFAFRECNSSASCQNTIVIAVYLLLSSITYTVSKVSRPIRWRQQNIPNAVFLIWENEEIYQLIHCLHIVTNS